jgi:hypothetical protein
MIKTEEGTIIESGQYSITDLFNVVSNHQDILADRKSYVTPARLMRQPYIVQKEIKTMPKCREIEGIGIRLMDQPKFQIESNYSSNYRSPPQ